MFVFDLKVLKLPMIAAGAGLGILLLYPLLVDTFGKRPPQPAPQHAGQGGRADPPIAHQPDSTAPQADSNAPQAPGDWTAWKDVPPMEPDAMPGNGPVWDVGPDTREMVRRMGRDPDSSYGRFYQNLLRQAHARKADPERAVERVAGRRPLPVW